MTTNRNDTATRLRNAMADRLKREGLLSDPAIESAFRAVPRHVFAPHALLLLAYTDEALPLKREGQMWLSSISQPSMIAMMLDQLALRAGDHVLEIGAGAGYNAALMAHIIGDAGHVITIDIDDDLARFARSRLAKAGVKNVEVICADGALGDATHAPYDRIILTVGASDIAPAWRAQMKPGGRLVLPIDFANSGYQFSIAFDKTDDCLVGRSFLPCGFIRLRGGMAVPPLASAAPNRPPSLGEVMLGSVAQVLPNVSNQLWQRRANRAVFGRNTLAGLSLRAYPSDAGYVPAPDEISHVQPHTRFVVHWET
jgi:protein-L-isoaspartate(D-aspartate) O-methyltransferase